MGYLLEKYLKLPWMFSALFLGIIISLFDLFQLTLQNEIFSTLSNMGMLFLLFMIGFNLEIDQIKTSIEDHGLKEEEKLKLLDMVHQIANMRVLDLILSQLPEKKQRPFLDKYCKLPHSFKLLEEIKQDIADIEEKLHQLNAVLKKEVLSQLSD